MMKSKTFNFTNLNIISISVIISTLLISALAGCAKREAAIESQPTPKQRVTGLITSGNYRSVEVSDLDNDGYLDIIGGGEDPGTITIWYGDENGKLIEFQSLPIKGDIRSIAIGDMNNDDLKDIVFSTQKDDSGVRVWVNQPGRKWYRGTSTSNALGHEGVRVADMNQDRFVDVMAAGGEGGIRVWLSDGKGAWPLESGPTKEGFFMDAAFGDFDKDGFIDIAASGWGVKGSLQVWFGDGLGGWQSTAPLAVGSFYALCIDDLNGDENPDILAGSYRNGIHIFFGDGKGSFRKESSPTSEGSYWKVLPFDLNDDSRLDLVASSINSQGIKAWINDDSGNWSELKARFPAKGTYYGIALGDLNRDGRNDLFAASFGEGIKVWMGKGKKQDTAHTRKVRRIPVSTAEKKREENDVYTMVDGIPQYKIGPRDVLNITLWTGTKKDEDEVTVREDGTITFKLVENLKVIDMTTIEVVNQLSNALKKYIKKPRIDVAVKRYDSKFVTFYGEVGSSATQKGGPGRYPLTRKISILEKLTEVGGPTDNANLNTVLVRHKNGKSITLNLFDVIIRGDAAGNIILNDGDFVTVPSIAKAENSIYIFGEVVKPGMYSFERPSMRMFEAISLAGGVTLFGKEEHTRVVRGDRSQPEVIPIDLKALLERGDHTQNILLTNGDFIYVPRTFIGDTDRFLRQFNVLIDLIKKPAQIKDIIEDTQVMKAVP